MMGQINCCDTRPARSLRVSKVKPAVRLIDHSPESFEQ